MLQISRRVDYAVRVMIELGLRTDDGPLSARELSQKTAVPKAFLHKITADLVKRNLVRTFAGPRGGLALAQPAAQITLLQIVEAADGPVCVNTCLLHPRECPRDRICPTHETWGRLQALIAAELQSTTLHQLVDQARRLRRGAPQNRELPYLFPEDVAA
jgi:Rrf2 family protein